MKLWMLAALGMAALFSMALAAPAWSAPKASFDCRKAKKPDEKTICSNEVLAMKDRETTAAFESAKRRDHDSAIHTAREFLARRAACKRDVACIAREQHSVMGQFASIGGGDHEPEEGAPRSQAMVYINRYADGSGSVAHGPDPYAFRWSYDCRVDKMVDRRKCVITSGIGGLFISFGDTAQPTLVCVLGHDFPGRSAMMRVDGNPPIETDRHGCVPASAIIGQLMRGSTLLTRYYAWPYDWTRDHESSLVGLVDCLRLASEVYAGKVL